MTKKIAFLGPRGTYTEEATAIMIEEVDDVEVIPYPTIVDCIWATQDGETDACVVPIENSIEGSVFMTLDTLVHEVDIPIRSEIVVPIAQTLYAKEKHVPIDQMKTLYSHPQAIAQCRKFIREHLPLVNIIETKSTAAACQYVSEHDDEMAVAIGRPGVESIYGLVDLAHDIEDYDNNFTRFILCGSDLKLPPSEQHKTSLLVTLPHDFQGALYQVLAAFAWRKINLSRIESRPTKKKLGSYHFFIDVEQSMDGVLLPGAVAEIEALGCHVRLLGSYPSYIKNTVRAAQ